MEQAGMNYMSTALSRFDSCTEKQQFMNEMQQYENEFYGNIQINQGSQKQQQQSPQFDQFVCPNKNFLDQEANTRQFYNVGNYAYVKGHAQIPQNQEHFFPGCCSKHTQQQQQQNANFYVPQQAFLDPQQQEPKLYELLQSQNKNSDILKQIDQLGGIEDTISVMEPSLKQYEVYGYRDFQPNFDKKFLGNGTANLNFSDNQYDNNQQEEIQKNVMMSTFKYKDSDNVYKPQHPFLKFEELRKKQSANLENQFYFNRYQSQQSYAPNTNRFFYS